MKDPPWLSAEDLRSMLWCMPVRKMRARKMRLLACACCRRVSHLLPDPGSRRALEASERYADGLISRKELSAVRAAAPGRGPNRASECAAKAAARCADPSSNALVVYAVASLAIDSLQSSGPAATAAHREQAALLRHIIGNPYRRLEVPECWPSSVVQLAEAIYAGEDCAFALHDALLENGLVEVAEHFREKDHPKGCWALDLILGRV